MQCREADLCSWCGVAQSSFYPASRAGWPPAVCLHSLAAQCCASVLPHLASLLPLFRIPFGALDLQHPATAWGNTSIWKKSPFWEGVVSFLREESLPLTGVPDGAQQAHSFFWLWTAIKLTITCLLMSLTKVHSATTLGWLFFPDTFLHIILSYTKVFPFLPNKIHAITRFQSTWQV